MLAARLCLPRLRRQQSLAAATHDLECAGCGKQTSVTAGTIMHHSKLPQTTWFWAAYLMATHSNGISALQLPAGASVWKAAAAALSRVRRAEIA